MLLVSFARLVAERPDLPLHLGLTGNLLDTGPDLATAIERIGLSSRIFHLAGFVSDEELAALYTDAFCLLFPSLYEGFGTPLARGDAVSRSYCLQRRAKPRGSRSPCCALHRPKATGVHRRRTAGIVG